MGWAIGYDDKWKRDIGYGVPCICDHPGCDEEIDRGLSYVCCGEEPHGGERGCGLYFCGKHHDNVRGEHSGLCERCAKNRDPFKPKPDTLEWIYFKMTDESWGEWRKSIGLPDSSAHDRTVQAQALREAADEWEWPSETTAHWLRRRADALERQ